MAAGVVPFTHIIHPLVHGHKQLVWIEPPIYINGGNPLPEDRIYIYTNAP